MRRYQRVLVSFLACVILTCLIGRESVAQQAPAGAQGVFVDADGVLRTVVVEEKGDRLKNLKRQPIGRAVGPVSGKTSLRKVSLAGVAREVRDCVAAGKPIPDEVRFLAGIQQIQFVFVYPEEKDVVIAGPAEGWLEDAAGRVIGATTKRPVVRLDDLIVALRVFPPGANANAVVGCTINQTEEGMKRLQQYMAAAGKSLSGDPRRVAGQLAQGVRDSLGMHDVEIWGVPGDSHLALVLVEADYRMKLTGLGLEDPRVRRLQSYYAAIGAGEAGRIKVQHWWFTPEYEAILRDEDGTAFEFRGQRAKLVGADDRPKADGSTEKGTTAGGATQRFAQSFTAHFDELTRAVPVYAELQNAFDLVILAALIQQGDLARRVAPDLNFLYETSGGYAAETLPVPKHVDSAVNAKVIGARLATPVGGVEMQPTRVLGSSASKQPADSKLRDRRAAAQPLTASRARWWAD